MAALLEATWNKESPTSMIAGESVRGPINLMNIPINPVAPSKTSRNDEPIKAPWICEKIYIVWLDIDNILQSCEDVVKFSYISSQIWNSIFMLFIFMQSHFFAFGHFLFCNESFGICATQMI